MFRVKLYLETFHEKDNVWFRVKDETIEARSVALLAAEILACGKHFIEVASIYSPKSRARLSYGAFELVRAADLGEIELLEDHLDGFAAKSS